MRHRSVLAVLAILVMAAVPFADPHPRDARGNTGSVVCPDSIIATARALTGETGIGPASRLGRRPSTSLYTAYLVQRLDAMLAPLGGSAWIDPFLPEFTDSPPGPVRNTYENVLGYLPGTNPAAPGMFVLGAHLDATAQTDDPADALNDLAPGADDNASGMTAILEAIRVATVRGLRPEADLLICFFDGEERQYQYDANAGRFSPSGLSLLGSQVVADSVIAARFPTKSIYGMVNLDMVAFNPRRDSLVVVTNASSRWLANTCIDLHTQPADPVAPGLELARLVRGLNFSDHASFWRNGVDAIIFLEAADIGIHARDHYHKRVDTVDNTYSRNGSQVARASEMILGLLELWSRSGAESLLVTDEDILVANAISQDVSQVGVSENLEVTIGVTNRGGTTNASWEVEALVGTIDGTIYRSLGRMPVSEVLPPGGRVKVTFPWVPTNDERGVTSIIARVIPPEGAAQEASRTVAVESSEGDIPRAYIYPNPTRDPASAVLRYELSREGAVRITLLDLTGSEIAQKDLGYDPVLPGPGVKVGLTEVPLEDLLQDIRLSPGLYFARVELFQGQGSGTADVSLTRFVVLR